MSDKNTSKFCYINTEQESKVKFPLLLIGLISFFLVLIIGFILASTGKFVITENIAIAFAGLILILVLSAYYYFSMRADKCDDEDIIKLKPSLVPFAVDKQRKERSGQPPQQPYYQSTM